MVIGRNLHGIADAVGRWRMMTKEEYAAWRKKSLAALGEIISGAGEGTNRFVWSTRMFGGGRCGIDTWYVSCRDLTARILDWWWSGGEDHDFFLGDAMAYMGDLWDREVEAIVWPKNTKCNHEAGIPDAS